MPLQLPWRGDFSELPLRWRTSGNFRPLDNGDLAVTTNNRVALAYKDRSIIAYDLGNSPYPVMDALWRSGYSQDPYTAYREFCDAFERAHRDD